MARRHQTAEGVKNKLREAEVGLANALTVPEVCRKLQHWRLSLLP